MRNTSHVKMSQVCSYPAYTLSELSNVFAMLVNALISFHLFLILLLRKVFSDNDRTEPKSERF